MANAFVSRIRSKAKENPRTIILPEMEDPRMQEAAKIIEAEGIAHLIKLSKGDLDPEKVERYTEEFYNMRKAKGITLESARAYMENPLFYAAMEVRHGNADGFVAGAVNTTADVVRAVLYCIGLAPRARVICGAFFMVVPDSHYGENGVLVFADCAVVPMPNEKQLAHIGVSTARLTREVLGVEPRVAFLSYSSKGSAEGPEVDKVRKAVALAKDMAPELAIDGELQVDSAIVPEVAQHKVKDSPVAGRANVLIFPDLNAGNISYKLVERLAKARAIGPIIMGGARPCSDLSRGCSVDDIVDCVAITVLRANNWDYGQEKEE